MKKHHSIDQLAATTVRQAQSEMAQMQRDLKALRDGISGLTHGIKAPIIRTARTRTKRTTTTSVWGLVAGLGASELLGVAGLSSGYTSAAQSAGGMLAGIALGQRIR